MTDRQEFLHLLEYHCGKTAWGFPHFRNKIRDLSELQTQISELKDFIHDAKQEKQDLAKETAAGSGNQRADVDTALEESKRLLKIRDNEQYAVNHSTKRELMDVLKKIDGNFNRRQLQSMSNLELAEKIVDEHGVEAVNISNIQKSPAPYSPFKAP